MKLLGTILLSLFATVVVQAQNADTYFHQSANSYINSQIQQALETVDEGLSRYPNDAKLNELKRKLEEEKEKQQQQQQQQQEQQQEEQDQDQEQQEQQNEEQDQQEPQEQEQQNEEKKQQEPQPQDAEELESKEISKEDAEKILKALAQKEKELLKDFKKKKSKDSAKHDKDW
ncbi:hypothetical protein [Balneola vulgaris]|uniref:hypothetical protein n=1 Tax=Balneola vulgaris TaxID=287535 RepID=UPI00036ACB49|nr:hypothetical protein [Balneola vulgaris]